ncbi:MAG: contractile injection system protein, VgrG/Pvc8 family [Pseudomonadota bacterium]
MAARANIAGYQLTVDGKDITGTVEPRLVSLTLNEKRFGDADQLDLVLSDHDGKLAIPKKGAVISLSLGWKQGADVTPGLVSKGSFKVDSARHSGAPDVITISARSADLAGAYRVRKEKSWRDTTLGAILQEIAGNAGLTPRIDATLAAKPIAFLAQHQKSDMALVRELGAKYDAVATVKDGKLVFAPKGKGATSTGQAIPDLTLTRKAGDRHDWSRVERETYDGAEARWHDQGSATRRTEHAGGSGGGGKRKRIRKVYASQADAQAAASAEAQRIARAAAEFSLDLALGRADIYPDRAVTVSGFKPEIDAAKWLIAEVSHSLDRSGGFRTKLKMETKV